MAFSACYLHYNLFNDPFASRSYDDTERDDDDDEGGMDGGCCMRQFS